MQKLYGCIINNLFFCSQLEPGQELPPPSLLRRKIIIKNKKKHHHHKKQKKQQQASDTAESTPESETNGTVNPSAAGENGPPPDIIPQNDMADGGSENEQQIGNGDIPHPPMMQQRQGSKDSAQDDEGLYEKIEAISTLRKGVRYLMSLFL